MQKSLGTRLPMQERPYSDIRHEHKEAQSVVLKQMSDRKKRQREEKEGGLRREKELLEQYDTINKKIEELQMRKHNRRKEVIQHNEGFKTIVAASSYAKMNEYKRAPPQYVGIAESPIKSKSI